MILSICEVPDVLKVMKIIRLIINILKIAVPIILIITCMLDYAGAINNPDKLSDVHKGIVRKAIAAVLVFFVPMFVGMIVTLVDPNGDTYVGCLNNATTKKIKAMYEDGMEERMALVRKNKDLDSYNAAVNYLNNVTDKDIKDKYKDELKNIKKEIDAKNPGETSTGSKTSSKTSGKKYNLSDEDVKYITRVCACEQDSVDGVKAEASLIANRYELYEDRKTPIVTYLKESSWFACKNSTKSVTDAQIDGVRDVLVNGNRVLPLYIDEHDCIDCNSDTCANGNKGDVCYLINDGKNITSMSEIKNKSNYISGKTTIKNLYNGTYTFYSFPCSGCDPFGYTSRAYDKVNK